MIGFFAAFLAGNAIARSKSDQRRSDWTDEERRHEELLNTIQGKPRRTTFRDELSETDRAAAEKLGLRLESHDQTAHVEKPVVLNPYRGPSWMRVIMTSLVWFILCVGLVFGAYILCHR